MSIQSKSPNLYRAVLGDYRDEFKFENMNKALKLLLQDTKLIFMIPEKVDHSLGGVELTVGAYGKMLEDAAGVKAIYLCKLLHNCMHIAQLYAFFFLIRRIIFFLSGSINLNLYEIKIYAFLARFLQS